VAISFSPLFHPEACTSAQQVSFPTEPVFKEGYHKRGLTVTESWLQTPYQRTAWDFLGDLSRRHLDHPQGDPPQKGRQKRENTGFRKALGAPGLALKAAKFMTGTGLLGRFDGDALGISEGTVNPQNSDGSAEAEPRG
jgi:hypothetical protein